MKALSRVARFLRTIGKKLRYGTHSREPLLLLRVEWRGDTVACDWLMRPADPWDRELAAHLAKENQTLQAFADAFSIREAIFEAFPAVTFATLQMFRADKEHRLELVMAGSLNRSDEEFHKVASLIMRARLYGFQFNLENGELDVLLRSP